MYNPSRGGVRGGADQFTWESVKNDKHRENYLGHSLMAPVGRWQKGKDLSWYAKGRKDPEGPSKMDKMELASIKKAEEEAMLIALGHNIVRKETQKFSKEEIQETLKRNANERDDHSFERIDGVGASNKRLALLSNAGHESRSQRGVAFEGYRGKASVMKDKKGDASSEEKRKNQKKSKKHKKEKKHKKKHHKESYDSDSNESNSKYRSKHKNSDSDSNNRKFPSDSRSHKKRYQRESCDLDSSENNFRYKSKYKKNDSDSDSIRNLSKSQIHKKLKHKHRDSSSDDSDRRHHSHFQHESHKRRQQQRESPDAKRHRHDTSESD